MANQKSKYTVSLSIRVSPFSKKCLEKSIPNRFASFSSMVDWLIKKDQSVQRKASYPHEKGEE